MVYPYHTRDTGGYTCSFVMDHAADGVFESHFKSQTATFLRADRNQRIVREEDSVNRKSRLMIGLVLVIMSLIISSWNSMIEPIVLHG